MVNDIYGLRAALDEIAEDSEMLARHAQIGSACRKALTDAGLRLYLETGFSNTVTVFEVPEKTTAKEILQMMREEHEILLAGSLGTLNGFTDMEQTMGALDSVLSKLGITLAVSLEKRFCELCEKCE